VIFSASPSQDPDTWRLSPSSLQWGTRTFSQRSPPRGYCHSLVCCVCRHLHRPSCLVPSGLSTGLPPFSWEAPDPLPNPGLAAKLGVKQTRLPCLLDSEPQAAPLSSPGLATTESLVGALCPPHPLCKLYQTSLSWPPTLLGQKGRGLRVSALFPGPLSVPGFQIV
jgi:hypothetical protein